MTTWQWKVILAIIRLVLKIEERTAGYDKWFDSKVSRDRGLLEDALKRELKDENDSTG